MDPNTIKSLPDGNLNDSLYKTLMEKLKRESRNDYLRYHVYSILAYQNDAIAQYNLGYCYQHGIGCKKNYNEAFKNYKLATEQNHASAQNNLGFCYQHGIGCDKNDIESNNYYKLAAEQNHPHAIVATEDKVSLSNLSKKRNNYIFDKYNNCKKTKI